MSEMPTESPRDEEDTKHGKYLTFSLGTEVFGVDIGFVTEIVGLQKISNIPESLDYVKGIINLRGKIIPVIDMRMRFKKRSAEYTGHTCIVVVDIQDITVGLIVDKVDEVISIPDTSIVAPPNYRVGVKNNYIKGIGKVNGGVRLLLDCENLFVDKEIQTLNKIKE
jgi:purine-binding chemotaxis protein CheW